MTDYGRPTPPDVALDQEAAELRELGTALRRDAQVLHAKADSLDEAVRHLEAAAQRYRQYQPKTITPTTQEPSP